MNATDLHELDGKVILVTSAADQHNPPSGMRGTLRVREVAGRQVVQVEVDFPQMFTTRAHHRTFTLTDDEMEQVLASDHYGTFSVTLPGRLHPDAVGG